MANEIVPGKHGTSVISDSYGTTIQVGPPLAQDTQEKWHPVLMEEDAVCARYDATPADLVAWRQFKFPAPRTKHLMARFSWTTKAVRSYVTDDLDEWDAQIRDLAAHLPRP